MLKDDYLRNHLYKFVLVVTYKPMQKFVISGPLLLLTTKSDMLRVYYHKYFAWAAKSQK